MVVSFIQKWGPWSHLCPEVGLGTEACGLLARCGEERSWGREGAAPSPVLEGLGFLKVPGCEFSPGTWPSLSEGSQRLNQEAGAQVGEDAMDLRWPLTPGWGRGVVSASEGPA